MSLKTFIAGKFASGGVLKRSAGLRDGEVPAVLSSQREWVRLKDGRIVEIHGGLFDPRYYEKASQ
jgi:hypothetical protein